MITTKALLGTATLGLATLVSSSAIAQSVVDTDSAGLIGKQYVGVDLFLEDFRDLPDNGTGVALSYNKPVSEVLDLSATLSMAQVDSNTIDLSSNALEGAAVYYSRLEGYTPFVFGALGYEWNEIDLPGNLPDDKDEGFFYRVGFGVEIPLADKTAAVVKLSYSDGVDSGAEDSFGGEVGINHWFTSKFAVNGSILVVEDDSVSFRIGARFAF